MRLITVNDILGQLAMWAVRQHPYRTPEGLFDLCQEITEAAEKDFKDGAASFPMKWFQDDHAIFNWLHWAVGSSPIIRRWNSPKSGHKHPIVFSSRYGGPAPEDDFIDIEALFRNVSRGIWSDARGSEKISAT